MIKSGRLTITTVPQSLIYLESIDSLKGLTISIKNLDNTNWPIVSGADLSCSWAGILVDN